METQGPVILVVDDDTDLRACVTELLADEGYATLGAADGREAIDLLRTGTRPDAVVLDLQMPLLDGHAVLREMRLDPELRDIPVLVISAGRQGASASEKTSFFAKPFDLSAFLDHLHLHVPIKCSAHRKSA